MASNLPQLLKPIWRHSTLLSALEAWSLTEAPPATGPELSTAITVLSESLLPPTAAGYRDELQKLMNWARGFSINIPDPVAVQDAYLATLGKLPQDLLTQAIEDTIGNWRWGNRLPFPAEIKAHVQPELMRRQRLLARAKIALARVKPPARPSPPADPAKVQEILDRLRSKYPTTTSKYRPSSSGNSETAPRPAPPMAQSLEKDRQRLDALMKQAMEESDGGATSDGQGPRVD